MQRTVVSEMKKMWLENRKTDRFYGCLILTSLIRSSSTSFRCIEELMQTGIKNNLFSKSLGNGTEACLNCRKMFQFKLQQ